MQMVMIYWWKIIDSSTSQNNAHTSLYFIMVWYRSVLPISFRVTSLALGQSYDYPSANEVTLKDMGKSSTCINGRWSCNHNKTKHSHAVHILWDILCLPFDMRLSSVSTLTHWGRVTHICVGKLTVIKSDNGLSPGRRQAIIRTNAGILLIRPLGTNFSEFLVEILIFSFKKMHLKV